jgi:tRNA (pseudouridine54-N1)-methyltransferase
MTSPSVTRRFVVIGQTATASSDFSLDDLPGSSGRLDVLLRCVRAALLVSHGVRRDTVIYLVLLGGPRAPRTLRFDGATSEYLRPDERSLAGAVRNLLGRDHSHLVGTAFGESTRGVALASGGLDAVIADLGAFTPYLLQEGATDLHESPLDLERPVFFLGDHLGVGDETRARLAELGAARLSIGPVSVHADDAIAIVANELDRRSARAR